MNALMIKDLEVSKELSCDERAAVRGGSITQVGSLQAVFAQNGVGLNIGSPVSATQVNPQSASETTVAMATVTASLGTLVGQFTA
jgi:hypothetical protein